MKSSFGRVFYAAALILLVALTMLGVSFQQLVKNYLTKTTFSRLDILGFLLILITIPLMALGKARE